MERLESRLPRVWLVTAAALLFLVFGLELYLSARLESQTFDEPAHMYAGYGYWLHSDFGINPEHPPLVKLVATLPVLVNRPNYPDPIPIFFRAQSAVGGMQMMGAPGADATLARVRTAVSVFAFALGLLVLFAAREMFGDTAGLLALLLFVFDPLILAHGPLLGTDIGATCCIFAAVYMFYRYTKNPTWMRLAVCCVAVGLAFAAKHSAILLIPILALLASYELLFAPRDAAQMERANPVPAPTFARRALKMAAAYFVIMAAAVVILWAFYGFRYAARPNGQSIVPSSAEYLQQLNYPGEARAIGFAERHHLLPESYLFGFTDVSILARDGRPMVLFGKMYAEGKWFYFPAAFVIKMTIGFMLLLALIPFARALRRREVRREVVFLLLPPALYFAAAMSAKVDIGIRHVLPVMPFLIVLAAGAAVAMARQGGAWRWAVAALVALDVLSSAHAFPNYLPYSNEAFGGPSRTYRVLADSNVGWGGGLKALHASLVQRGITQCWFAYSSFPDPKNFAIPCQPLPTYLTTLTDRGQQQPVPVHIDGPVFIGSYELAGAFWGPGALNPYEPFTHIEPSRVIAGEILEFDGSFDIPKVSAVGEWVMASGLLRQQRLDQAIAHAQKAEQLNPDSIDVHELLMHIYADEHQNDAAEREFAIASKLYRAVDPAFAEALLDEPRDPVAKK